MDEFLKRIEFFLTQTGMSATTLGWQALKNPNFVFNLRNGRGCTVSSMKKVDDFMNSYNQNSGERIRGKDMTDKEKLDIYGRVSLFESLMTHFKQDAFKYFNQTVDLIEGKSEPETSSPEMEVNRDNQD